MANKQPEIAPPPPEAAKPRNRLVNRNAHLSAAAKIVAVLEKVDPAKWDGILKTVRDALQFQPELPGFDGEEAK